MEDVSSTTSGLGVENRFRNILTQAHSPEWEELHIQAKDPFIITASAVSSVLGLGYSSPKSLWELYTGRKKPYKDATDAMRYGNTCEEYALDQLKKDFPATFVNPGPIWHPTVPFLLASPDALGISYPVKDPTRALFNVEIKCPISAPIPKRVQDIPEKFLIQTQVQMSCLGNCDLTLLYFWSEEEKAAFWLKKSYEFEAWFIEKLLDFKKHVEQDKLWALSRTNDPVRDHSRLLLSRIEGKLFYSTSF